MPEEQLCEQTTQQSFLKLPVCFHWPWPNFTHQHTLLTFEENPQNRSLQSKYYVTIPILCNTFSFMYTYNIVDSFLEENGPGINWPTLHEAALLLNDQYRTRQLQWNPNHLHGTGLTCSGYWEKWRVPVEQEEWVVLLGNMSSPPTKW